MVEIFKIFQGCLTLLIACIVAYIAIQQYLVNKRKLQLDLFDKRLQIYEELISLLNIIASLPEEKQNNFQIQQFTNDIRNCNNKLTVADFLFEDDEVITYLKNIRKRSMKTRTAYIQVSNGKNLEKNELIKEEELKWFSKQFDESRRIFVKAMKV
ncbi:hypothetical protein QUF74_01165 [Candidatus Halobeggiatoa sp. HSG11]|nr:hypothetical protein [Candidatus Halobeggiatoa sp. HSG11]